MPDPLAAVAARQYGVWTEAQARQHGHSEAQIRWRARSGAWRRVVRGAYCAPETRVDQRVRGAAVSLVRSAPTILSHATAAAFHGFHLTGDERVHVTYATQRWRPLKRVGLVAHRTELADADVIQVGPLLLTSPLRTLLDLNCSLPGADGLAAVDRALRVGAVEQGAFREFVSRAVQRPGVRTARTVAAWADPRAESPPESHLRWAIVASALPVPQPQAPIGLRDGTYRVDLGYRAARIGLEYDSDRHHASGLQRRRDRDRHEALRREGWQLLYVTPYELYRTPAETLRRTERALRERGIDPIRTRRHQEPGSYLS